MTQRKRPAFLPPMAARLVLALPTGKDWIYEVKFDGYRALLLKDGNVVRILSRNEKDLTAMFPLVVAAVRLLKAKQATIDGEIVALDEHGRPSFQALQHRGAHPLHAIAYYGFDLLHLNGQDLINEPLVVRREKLTQVLRNSGLLLSMELPGTPARIVDEVRALGLEGVVAKRRGSRYQPGERPADWQKFKLEHQQEFVIGGYRPAGRNGMDALLVGYFDGKGLQFAGKIQAGFVPHVRRDLANKLKALAADSCAFMNLPNSKSDRWGGGVTADEMKEMRWARPELVVQIRFLEWTSEGRLRHPVFVGLRPDKKARDVCRE